MTRTIGDLIDGGTAELRTGPFGTQLKAADYADFGTPVINVRNVGLGDIRKAELEYVGDEICNRLSMHLLKEGDIVFGRKGAVERHAYVSSGQEGWMQGSDCIRLRLSGDELNPRLFSFALRTREHQSWMQAQCSHGATMASLNQEVLRRIPVPELPMPLQRRVVAVLGGIDDLIVTNERRIELLDESARTLYVRAVAAADEESIPLASVARVNELALRTRDLPDQLNYIDISAVSPRRINEIRPVAKADAPSRARRLVRNGDTMWSTVRPNRRAHALIVDPAEHTICSTGFAVLTPTRVPASFLFEATSTQEFADYLTNHATGAAYPAVNPRDFERALLPRLDDLDLEHLDILLAPMHAEVDLLRRSNLKLTGMRDLLLPKLVSGELDVSELDLDHLMELVD